MPIELHSSVERISQAEFGKLAYEVMRCVFEIHNDMGRFFDEKIYKRELARRYPAVQLEVPIEVRHGTFLRIFFLDALVSNAGLFEFKAVDHIGPRHRAQTLNYLYLANLGHAKVVNLRPEQVEHEFVNTTFTRRDRLQFHIAEDHWNDQIAGAAGFRQLLTDLLYDWGAGLQVSLYQDALVQLLGGEERVSSEVEVRRNEHVLGHHRVCLLAPTTAFMLTALTGPRDSFRTHAERLLMHTDLRAIVWADLSVKRVVFTTIER